ncbi:integrase catalytic domain-containing protein [Trichonephila clavipes]|nr:integrase catalytic domain-containing protein [Trichonephila clavipes]
MRLQVRKGTVDGYEWRCRNQSKDNRLDVVRSVRKGTWFSESKLAKTIILRLTRYWFGKSMNAFVVNDLKVNKKGEKLLAPKTAVGPPRILPLPKIELKKFVGNAKEHLTFWSQFKKIHEDESLPNEDKFQYLLQAVISNSNAAQVVESFPATAENYPKAIAQLQERFGREDLPVQIYVRDLLSMEIEELKKNMKILPDGRYELYLPFKSEVINLSSNKDLTWKQHKKMCERAQRNGILDNYKVVFKEWEELVIIEKIEQKGESSYFLPHRPRHQGPNLIEQIPDILDKFRRYPIGLSADIGKAFLQLGITPKHRDFLRFFYPDEGEENIYRHCRVVFGVSSSPFLLAAVLAHLLENVPADDTQLGSKLKLSFYVDNCVTGVNNIAQQEEFIFRSKEILSRGCFNLRNWESNVESKHISKKYRHN